MKYKFPTIQHIDDVLPHIVDCDDFIVADKGDHKVINYVKISSDTFRPANLGWKSDDNGKVHWIWDEQSIMRRECRGLIFDKDGNILSRRFHKFFNVGEREETLIDKIDLNQPHTILEKLDGSMVTPIINPDTGELFWGTKMGRTDISEDVAEFVEDKPEYKMFAAMCHHLDRTPIFEFCARSNRVVIDHPETKLVLLAVRDNITGKYLKMSSDPYKRDMNVPHTITIVKEFEGSIENMEELISHTRGITDGEGYVIRFDDGHMVKIKSDWYVAIHKAKEKILYERYIVDMIIDQTIDDVIPYLQEHDREKLNLYIDDFARITSQWSHSLNFIASKILQSRGSFEEITRKEFALQYAEGYGKFASIIFSNWDNLNDVAFNPYKYVHEVFRKQTTSNSKLEQFKTDHKIKLEW